MRQVHGHQSARHADLYTEDVGLPYFDRAVVTTKGYW